MAVEATKLFIGGISRNTSEERLKKYFETYGEVMEAVIIKDRTTGRARGFGFVIFFDPKIAERVVKSKHLIDGKIVEAKKALPKDDLQLLKKSNGGVQSSSSLACTRKIFVGGLASMVTENDLKSYFDQFGSTTDVLVMYDHNTQQPRGFGFVTFESEESVEKVLLPKFHELNGKIVEVRRAVPRESSRGSNRSNVNQYYYGLSNRVGNYFNGYVTGYNPSSLGGYGMRVDRIFNPVTVGRTGYSPFIPSIYNNQPVFDSGLGNFRSNLGYGRARNMFVGHNGGDGNGNASVLNSINHGIRGNGYRSYNTNNSANSSNFLAQGNGFGSVWANSSSSEGGYGGRGVDVIGYGRNRGNSIAPAVGDGNIGGGSVFMDSSWRSLSRDYESGSGGSDGIPINSVGYVGYSVANRSNRGISA